MVEMVFRVRKRILLTSEGHRLRRRRKGRIGEQGFGEVEQVKVEVRSSLKFEIHRNSRLRLLVVSFRGTNLHLVAKELLEGKMFERGKRTCGL